MIDGQHRLYGIANSEKAYDIPVTIFNNLTLADEVSLFVDINTTQRGVPTPLLLDIKQLANKETSKEEKQRELFDRLNQDSCLAGQLSPSQTRRGNLSRATFNTATNDIFENSLFQDETVDNIYKSLKNYLEASEKALASTKSKKARLTSSVVFKALMTHFNAVVKATLEKHGNLKVDSILDVVEPISRLDYDLYIGTNKVTIQRLINDMDREIFFEDKIPQDLSDDIF